MGVNFKEYDALVARFEAAGKDAKKELGQALISSQRAAKTEFGRAALVAYTLKSGTFKRNLSITNVDKSALKYTVVGSEKPITIKSYGARKKGNGLSVQFLKSGAQKDIPGGFFPSSGARAKVPFKRVGRKRYPLDVLFGPSAAEILAGNPIKESALKNTKDRLALDIKRRINRIVKRG